MEKYDYPLGCFANLNSEDTICDNEYSNNAMDEIENMMNLANAIIADSMPITLQLADIKNKDKKYKKMTKDKKFDTYENIKEIANNVDIDDEQNKIVPKKRAFRGIYKNPNGVVVYKGRYKGDKPKQAANKALTRIYKVFKNVNFVIEGDISFGVLEITRGSKNKRYWYRGKRKTLDGILEVSKGVGGAKANDVKYKHKNDFKKIKEEGCIELVNCKPNNIDLQDDDDLL